MDAIRKRLAVAFPTKEILIGETGWPSKGRMRVGALPSRINQARFDAEFSIGRSSKTFASLCSRPTTGDGSANGKEPWAAIGACSMEYIAS